MVIKGAFQTLLTIMIVFVVLVSGCDGSAGLPTQSDGNNLQKNSSPTQDDSKILLVTSEYIPYTSQNLPDDGIFTKIVKEICANANIEIEIQFFPWGRCEEMVQSGEAWASLPYSHSDSRDSLYLFCDPICETKHKFYYLAGNEEITGKAMNFTKIADFKGFTFGGANGYWYGNQEDVESLGVKAEWADDTDSLLKMLYAGRIDFIIEDELVFEEAIARLFPEEKDKFLSLPHTARKQQYHLIVSKVYPESEELLKKFNDSLKDLKANGEIQQILDMNCIG